MSKVRIAYAGMVGYLSSLFNLITGFLFIIIITRNLTIQEFGSWQVIASVIGYALIPAIIPSYWSFRNVARGQRIATTSFIINAVLSLFGIAIFLFILTFILPDISLPIQIVLLATCQVPIAYMFTSVKTTAHGNKVEAIGYSSFLMETVKILVAYILISQTNLGLAGAFITVLIATSIQILFLAVMVKNQFLKKLHRDNIKKWFKSAWVPLFTDISNKLLTLDVVLITLLTKSTETVAYFKSAYVFAIILFNTQQFAIALRTKLLQGGNKNDIESTLKLILFFTIPLIAGCITMAKPLLYILNPLYVQAEITLQILSVGIFFYTISHVFNLILTGIDDVDKYGETRFNVLKNSFLVKLPTIDGIFRFIYLILLSSSVILITRNELSYDLTMIWATLFFITHIPLVIIKWNFIHVNTGTRFPYKTIMTTCFSSLIMSFVVLSLTPRINYNPNIIDFIFPVIGIIALGAFLYFSILLIIDQDFRKLSMEFITKYIVKNT